MVSVENNQQSATANHTVANARVVIANKWLEEATKRVDRCIAQRDQNGAPIDVDKEARAAQYFLAEARYYYELTQRQDGIEAVDAQRKRLLDAGVKILNEEEMHPVYIELHTQMIEGGERLGLKAYVADLKYYRDRHIAATKGIEMPRTPESDINGTILFTGEEAVKFAMDDLQGGISTQKTGDLIEAAFSCARLLENKATQYEWEHMIGQAQAAIAECPKLIVLERNKPTSTFTTANLLNKLLES